MEKSRHWKLWSGNPVNTYRQNGRYCREFTQEIFIGGEKTNRLWTSLSTTRWFMGNNWLKIIKAVD